MKQEADLLATPERIIEFFSLLLADESEGIRWALATILSTISLLSEKQKFDFLLQLANDQHYWVRRETLTSIKRLTSTMDTIPLEILSVVKKGVFDNNPEVRYAAIDCLVEYQHLPDISLDIPWSNFLRDDDQHIRRLVKEKIRV